MTDKKFETVISWEDSLGEPRYMVFDVVQTVAHRKTVELTESPVDGGSPVADHAFLKPNVVTITGLVSNTPLPSNPGVGEPSELIGGGFMRPTTITWNVPKPPPLAPVFTPGGLTSRAVRGAEGLVRGLLGRGPQDSAAGVWTNSGDFFDRTRQAFNTLAFMQSEFSRCSIITALESYEGMILTSMIVPEDVDDTKEFQLEFREVQTASTRDVEAPEPAEIRGTPPNQSSKETKKTDNENDKADNAKKSSVLKKLIDSGVDYISP